MSGRVAVDLGTDRNMTRLLTICTFSAVLTAQCAGLTSSRRQQAPVSNEAQTSSLDVPQGDASIAIEKSIGGLRGDINGLKNDPSKYLLLLIGGAVGVVSSVLTALVNGYVANKNKATELQAISTSKTKELLVNQIIGFEGKTQPRAAILAAVRSLHTEYPDLQPLFREFLVSQMEYLITHGYGAPLEQSNALVILQTGAIFTAGDRLRIKSAWQANPGGSDRGLTMSQEAIDILKTY
jgi:hypothetical protein